MASQSTKKLAAANTEILNQTHLIAVIINLLVIVILVVFKRPKSFIPYLIFSFPAFLCQFIIEQSARPVYVEDKLSGQRKLIKAGEDVKHEGLYEYMFDTMYITWIIDVLMIVLGTNKVWWLYTIIPGFAIFKIVGLVKGFKGSSKAEKKPEEQETPQKSKRQAKREANKNKVVRNVR
mmetsp:Transcript_6505/g.8156  ORF Transcript_6505/g.8156 Transcript_6505/m.8156 type:complete len:178 (+) Transcript_6505:9505-10038(+)